MELVQRSISKALKPNKMLESEWTLVLGVDEVSPLDNGRKKKGVVLEESRFTNVGVGTRERSSPEFHRTDMVREQRHTDAVGLEIL